MGAGTPNPDSADQKHQSSLEKLALFRATTPSREILLLVVPASLLLIFIFVVSLILHTMQASNTIYQSFSPVLYNHCLFTYLLIWVRFCAWFGSLFTYSNKIVLGLVAHLLIWMNLLQVLLQQPVVNW